MQIFKLFWGVFKLYGTVSYYSERFLTTVMNRLVVNDAFSLEEYYVKLKEEISTLNESEKMKHTYNENLNKAYEKIADYIYGVENEKQEQI